MTTKKSGGGSGSSKGGSGSGGSQTHYRDAGSGQYVKPGYANKHPGTTVKETDRKK